MAAGGGDWGDHIAELFHESQFFLDHPSLLPKITLVIGYHPDQATEHILNSALMNNTSFCVLPCCVFPLDGVSMSFADWVDYLHSKDPAIERTRLNARGRNVILYKTK
jgi:hypothetical protein